MVEVQEKKRAAHSVAANERKREDFSLLIIVCNIVNFKAKAAGR